MCAVLAVLHTAATTDDSSVAMGIRPGGLFGWQARTGVASRGCVTGGGVTGLRHRASLHTTAAGEGRHGRQGSRVGPYELRGGRMRNRCVVSYAQPLPATTPHTDYQLKNASSIAARNCQLPTAN